MINIDTLISSFNERGTLLKWLQKVEAALNNATLTSVQVQQQPPVNGNNVVKLDFIFNDGTDILSDAIIVPRGPQGIQGEAGKDGTKITGVRATESDDPKYGHTLFFHFIDSNGEEYTTNEVDLPEGSAGNGIVSIHSIGHSTVGDEEVTKVQVVTDNDTQEFEVHARNGTGGGNTTDLYAVWAASTNPNIGTPATAISFISTKPISSVDELITYIYTLFPNNSELFIPATGYFRLQSDLNTRYNVSGIGWYYGVVALSESGGRTNIAGGSAMTPLITYVESTKL